ncbi:MAG: CFI-box-CTERM domain-containing protein [Bacteroidia bacterium]
MAKTYIDENGYRRFTDSGKLVHRWVSEKNLDRKLKSGEVVHHKDRNKRNNSWDNLHVFKSQAEHDWVHKKDAAKYGKKASYQGFKKKNEGCFIATACYGDYDATEVLILRQYRDNKLLTNYFGKLFVAIYYSVSPFFATIISKSDRLKNIVRQYLLQPIVKNLAK